MVDFDFISISEIENKLIAEAKGKYGKVYENAESLVFLVWDFLKSAEADAWIFVSFLSQVQKFATLSLLSTLRHHNAQSFMNIRQIFEAGVLAAYSLRKGDDKAFYYKDENDVAYVNEDVRMKAYKWLEQNYESHSNSIKNQKEIINSMWTHSSILLTSFNFELNGEQKLSTSLFDKEDDFHTKSDLWFLANSCWGFLDLFAKEITKTKMAKLSDDFVSKMTQYGKDNEELKKEFTADPRIRKWENIIKKNDTLIPVTNSQGSHTEQSGGIPQEFELNANKILKEVSEKIDLVYHTSATDSLRSIADGRF
jgi:hypothetical protein